jgi:hypothetical protein
MGYIQLLWDLSLYAGPSAFTTVLTYKLPGVQKCILV